METLVLSTFIDKDIFGKVLADALGLEKYKLILKIYDEHGVDNISFQRSFNSFFKVRRNSAWRETFYSVFLKCSNQKDVSFKEIITTLYAMTNQIEPSFSSKMLHVINPNYPIWDQYVIKNLGLKLTGNKETKLHNAIKIYDDIINWYGGYLVSKTGKEFIDDFDQRLPRFRDITNVKKIDSVLWKLRDYE